MLRSTALGVFVVLLVVTAGCLGDGPAASPAVGTDGGGGDVGGGGSDEAATIVENRTAALAAAGSYTSTWRMRSVEDGTIVSEMSYVTATDYANERYSFETTITNGSEVRTAMASYYADGRQYQRIGDDDRAAYASNEDEFGAVVDPGRAAFVSAAGDLDEFTFVGTETYDGVNVRRYEMTETASWIAAQAQTDGEVRWTDFSYAVLVDDQGLVRSEHWSGTGVDDAGTERTIEFAYELTGVGSTEVAEPAWFAEAAAAA